jgi:hypothetical protein
MRKKLTMEDKRWEKREKVQIGELSEHRLSQKVEEQ